MGLRTQKRRRKENRTDYRLRLSLLKSGKQRIVIRRSDKYFLIQLVESNEAQDKVLKTVSSRDLLKYGWDEKKKGSLKNIPAGYLTGKLFGKDLEKKEYIIDLGMYRTISGNRMYAVVKGLVDAGVNLNVNEKVFPPEERIKGEHLNEEVKLMISKVEAKIN
jgi:large subunit ribosomal protein L18